MTLAYWHIAIGLVTLGAWALDKRRAKQRGWRIPERSLLGLAAAGGSPAAWIGCELFRHKSSKRSFRIRLALATLTHMAWLGYILYA